MFRMALKKPGEQFEMAELLPVHDPILAGDVYAPPEEINVCKRQLASRAVANGACALVQPLKHAMQGSTGQKQSEESSRHPRATLDCIMIAMDSPCVPALKGT